MLKINQNIKTNLFSADTKTVIAAINQIKQKGNKLYIPILFELLNSNPETEIETEIKSLLATVKDKDAVAVFMSAFDDEKYRPIWKTVLTACWQNGLDYSNYIVTFIELIINEEWEIAFEAFTIIDNLEFLPEQKIIDESRKIISSSIESANEQKTYFLQEVLTKIGQK